jgi:hypothetical protein
METFMKKLEGAFLQHLEITDIHWIHVAREAGSHERRSEFSEVLAKLNDYQIFKEGCSMDFVACFYINRQQMAPIQSYGVGKRQHKTLPYLLLFQLSYTSPFRGAYYVLISYLFFFSSGRPPLATKYFTSIFHVISTAFIE